MFVQVLSMVEADTNARSLALVFSPVGQWCFAGEHFDQRHCLMQFVGLGT